MRDRDTSPAPCFDDGVLCSGGSWRARPLDCHRGGASGLAASKPVAKSAAGASWPDSPASNTQQRRPSGYCATSAVTPRCTAARIALWADPLNLVGIVTPGSAAAGSDVATACSIATAVPDRPARSGRRCVSSRNCRRKTWEARNRLLRRHVPASSPTSPERHLSRRHVPHDRASSRSAVSEPVSRHVSATSAFLMPLLHGTAAIVLANVLVRIQIGIGVNDLTGRRDHV